MEPEGGFMKKGSRMSEPLNKRALARQIFSGFFQPFTKAGGSRVPALTVRTS